MNERIANLMTTLHSYITPQFSTSFLSLITLNHISCNKQALILPCILMFDAVLPRTTTTTMHR